MSEEDYELGEKFLRKMGAIGIPVRDPEGGEILSFYLDNKQQLIALLEFRKSLRDRR